MHMFYLFTKLESCSGNNFILLDKAGLAHILNRLRNILMNAFAPI